MGETTDDELLPFDEEDHALAQGTSPVMVTDAYGQGVAAGRDAERAEIVAWLRKCAIDQAALSRDVNPDSDLYGLTAGVMGILVSRLTTAALLIERGEHDPAPVPDKVDSTT